MTTAQRSELTPPSAPSDAPYDAEMKEAGQLTSPTYELELFLSGAFIFATFQLPGLIESAVDALAPHATQTTDLVLFMGALYGKAIAFTLIAMFSVHLVARAYWVALLGLHSVFPDGVRWTELKMGPITRSVYRARTPRLSKTAERLDNFCSVVFSVGLMLACVFLYTTLLVAVMGGAAYFLASKFSHGAGIERYFFGIAIALAAIPTIPALWDRKYGDRYPAGSATYRWLQRALRLAYVLNFTRVLGPLMLTLSSNLGRKKSLIFMLVAIVGLIVLSAVDRLEHSGLISLNTYDFFATSRAHGVNYRFYESQRDPDAADSRTPSIQSDIIRDPYVRLFIPYFPLRDNDAIARQCPSVKPLQTRGLQVGGDTAVADSLVVPVLDCITRLRAVKLDGAAIPDLQFSFYEQPASGLKGVIAYIAVDSLSHGRHELTVAPMPRQPASQGSKPAAPPQPTIIPFWR